MTMDLTGDAFFKSYLVALTDKQLDALAVWQEERMSGDSDKDTVTDAFEKKRIISSERRRR